MGTRKLRPDDGKYSQAKNMSSYLRNARLHKGLKKQDDYA